MSVCYGPFAMLNFPLVSSRTSEASTEERTLLTAIY
jgi:hypothetical protein